MKAKFYSIDRQLKEVERSLKDIALLKKFTSYQLQTFNSLLDVISDTFDIIHYLSLILEEVEKWKNILII